MDHSVRNLVAILSWVAEGERQNLSEGRRQRWLAHGSA